MQDCHNPVAVAHDGWKRSGSNCRRCGRRLRGGLSFSALRSIRRVVGCVKSAFGASNNNSEGNDFYERSFLKLRF